MMRIPETIAIDGPAASGKSSVGLDVANYFGYLFLDTGVMYRAVTWKAINHSIDLNDEQKVSDLVNRVSIDIKPPSVMDGRVNDIVVDSEDITWNIRAPEVNYHVSLVSSYQEVRQVLTSLQREIGLKGKVVMVGRDIGTVVLPDAEIKIFLNASAEERAKRRYKEELERGEKPNFHDLFAALKERDKMDSSRIFAPLLPAEDAIIIDTDYKQKTDVVNEIIKIAIEKGISQ